MIKYDAGCCDVAVIGAGHAGIEAALAAARLGLDTVCFTVNLDSVGNMPCNPAIGGTGKGPAVHSLRAQCDRRRYQEIMKHTLERQEHLLLRQAEIARIEAKNGHGGRNSCRRAPTTWAWPRTSS